MDEIEFRLKELSTRVHNLRKFVIHELSEVILRRFTEIEEEMENLRKELYSKVSDLEERLRKLEIEQKEMNEYSKTLEKLSRKINKNILKELE